MSKKINSRSSAERRIYGYSTTVWGKSRGEKHRRRGSRKIVRDSIENYALLVASKYKSVQPRFAVPMMIISNTIINKNNPYRSDGDSIRDALA